jgi:hypothetical protein
MTQAVAGSSTPTVSDAVSRLLTQEAAALETQIAVETQFVQAQPARETQQALETAVIDSIRATETASGTGMSVLRMQVIAQGTLSAAGYQPTPTPWPFPVTIVPVGVGRDEAWKMTAPEAQFAAMVQVGERLREVLSFRDAPPSIESVQELESLLWRNVDGTLAGEDRQCGYSNIIENVQEILAAGYYLRAVESLQEPTAAVDLRPSDLLTAIGQEFGATTALYYDKVDFPAWDLIRIADGRTIYTFAPEYPVSGIIRAVWYRFDSVALTWKVVYYDNAYCSALIDRAGETSWNVVMSFVEDDIRSPLP